MKIAINGPGVAGPALAYWLLKGGHEILLVEEAAELRGPLDERRLRIEGVSRSRSGRWR
ncbi:MAG: hypothetical protein ABJA02_15335 [Acidobacteriota bacterium]